MKNLYDEPRGIVHYNVHFKDGSFTNRVSERVFCGLRAVEIDSLYIVEEDRNVTSEEIKRLCKRDLNSDALNSSDGQPSSSAPFD
jgi:hypothetical protein